MSPRTRWALTPPFHPYLTSVGALGRRFVFCGTSRHTSRTGRTFYQPRVRPGITWQPAHGARTFLGNSTALPRPSDQLQREFTKSTIESLHPPTKNDGVLTTPPSVGALASLAFSLDGGDSSASDDRQPSITRSGDNHPDACRTYSRRCRWRRSIHGNAPGQHR